MFENKGTVFHAIYYVGFRNINLRRVEIFLNGLKLYF
jgi:hypothetical protein